MAEYHSKREFDLVICQGVLQYLDDKSATAAIANLAPLTRGALFLEALTSLDWQTNCDREVTDGDVRLRAGHWYRRRLAPHFKAAGGGLFVTRTAPVSMFELETLG